MPKRIIAKTISYAVMHMTLSVTIAYILSGSWQVALAIGFIEPCAQTIAFFFHERVWHKIERHHHEKDYHDSIVDSASPVSSWVEGLLRRKARSKRTDHL